MFARLLQKRCGWFFAGAICLCFQSNRLCAVTFDWAAVGNPGNTADTTGFGAVQYTYRISKHEVTNAQYTEFLNAVAATDTNGLYNTEMESDARGGIIQTGFSGNFSYAVKAGRGNNPVVYVSFFEVMRFVNWLENGQPTGAQGPATTEEGVYTINDGLSETRTASATYSIPSEDEWYKAAYHKNDGITGNYWDHPTSTDAIPFSDQPPGSGAPDTSNAARYANYFNDDGDVSGYNDGYAVTGSIAYNQSQNYLTDVGAYSFSESPYGTFDQVGNVFEWNEAVISSSFRGLRGGSWGSALGFSTRGHVSHRGGDSPTREDNTIGFRVASIPGSAVSGDYNHDVTVDAADYVVWRKGVGVAPTPANYNLWRAHFGETLGNGSGATANATVPEPATLVMLIMAAAASIPLRRRRIT